MEEELKELGFNMRWSDDPNRDPIDFTIDDGNDNVCWVWGKTPEDVEVECNHPAVDYNYDKEHHQGRCEICGAICDVAYHADWDGYKISEPFVVEWYPAKKIGGIVGEYLDKLRKEF